MARFSLDPQQVQSLPKTHEATIPTEYLDAMGHMNVMWYTHLFSMGMGELLNVVGWPWERMAETENGTFALETRIRYLSEVRVGHHVEIRARVLERTSKRYHTLLVMVNQTKSDVAAVYETITAFIDLKQRRMAPMPESLTAELDRLIEQQKVLDWESPFDGSMKP